MGIISCRKHGVSGVSLVSSDIQKQVIANKVINNYQEIEVLLTFLKRSLKKD